MKFCSIDGCSGTHKARGYCDKHYLAWRVRGDALSNAYPNRRFKLASECSVDDCDRTSYGKGYCRKHYKRLLRFGSTELPVREKPVCSVESCDRTAHARGLCGLHVKRLYKLGTTELNRPTDEERFWAKVDRRGPDDCWEWQGSRHPQGHGYCFVDGALTYAHRYSLSLHLGRALGADKMACHHCDNPPCVNPAHLYEGDGQSNIDDMIGRGRAWWQKNHRMADL